MENLSQGTTPRQSSVCLLDQKVSIQHSDPNHYEVSAAAVVETIASSTALHECLQPLEQYAVEIRRQHALLASQMTELIQNPIRDCSEATSNLLSTAEQLECIFQRIDALENSLNEIYEKTNIINQAVKSLQAPQDFSDKAKELFKSWGFGKKDGDKKNNADSKSGVWGRVNPDLVLDGSTPAEFAQRVRGVFSDFDPLQ